MVGALAIAFAVGLLFGQRAGPWPAGASADAESGGGPMRAFEAISEERLQAITASLRELQGLHRVVVKADDTYEEVYHKQLVRQFHSASPDEQDWNSFVEEARTTGPSFLEGKERLRDAVTNMNRLIRKTPAYLRNLVRYLKEENPEEAIWYLGKVVALVDSIKQSMDLAAARFGEVDGVVGGMARDAKENEIHMEQRASALIGEARQMEGSAPLRTGAWTHLADRVLGGCQLGKLRASLDACKAECAGHDSGACTQISYYKTTSWSNCYLHCASAKHSESWSEVDVYVLEQGPEQVAGEVARKMEGGAVAGRLQQRWRTVQGPLGEVSHLVRRFRMATSDLRRCLEDVRFASDDLRTAFASPSAASGVRLLERLVGDLAFSIEDLGESLAPLRMQRQEEQQG